MDKKLSYGLMLSLKEISLRRVTVILWSQTDILASFDKRGVEDKVKDNISKLPLPPLLTEQMKYLVKPIESEIRNWKLFHEKYLNISPGRFDLHILEKLCWTVLGTVDFRTTAENLIRFKMLYVLQRYRLACLYCLDDYIPNLWNRLPEWRNQYLYKENPFYYTSHPPLEFCWPHILKGEETKLDSMVRRKIGDPFTVTFNQYAFQYSAHKGNKGATEYYFRKLTNVEKEAFLYKTTRAAIMHRLEHYNQLEDFPEEKHSETICYLLSLMNLEQQVEICKGYTGHVFICLLDWPWQSLFWVVAEHFWPFLETLHYGVLLHRIVDKISVGHPLAKLFQKIFLLGSSNHRKDFVDVECESHYALRVFFDLQDSETIKFIFRNVDSSDRKRLVSTRNALEHFYQSILRGRGYLVKICIQEATLSKDDKQQLKESYLGFFTQMGMSNVNIRDNISEQFLQFLN